MQAPTSENFARGKLQAFFLIAGKITALMATFAIPLILTRLLSKSEYGIFAQFYVVVFFCTEIFNLSMQSNLYYYYPTADAQKRKSLIVQTLLFLVFVALFAISLLSIPGLGNLIIGEGELLKYKSFILTGVILFMPLYILEPLYVAKKDVYTSLIYPPAEVLLRLTMITGFFLIKPGLYSIFTGVLVSAAVSMVFALAYSLKEVGFKNLKPGLLKKELAREQLTYSIPFGLAVSLNILFQRFDKIICISFLTSAEFAVYAIAFFGIPGILQVFDSLSQVYLIKMTVKHQEKKTAELGEIYKSLVAKTTSFSFPVLLIVWLYAKKIILVLFTSNYLEAVPLFRVYLTSILIFMLCSGLILRATGKTNYTLKSYTHSAFVVLPLTYVLIRLTGVWGAMAGALVSIALPRFLNLGKEIKLIGSSFATFFPWKKFGQIGLISVASIIPFATLEYFFDYGTIVTALLGLTYLSIVSLFEVKYNLFPQDISAVTARLAKYTRFSNITVLKKYLPFL